MMHSKYFQVEKMAQRKTLRYDFFYVRLIDSEHLAANSKESSIR